MLTIQEVEMEIIRSRDLHGPLTKDMRNCALILARECLEAMQEAYDAQRIPRLSTQRSAIVSNLRAELVQVVAVASQWVTNLDQEREREEHERQS